MPKVPRFVAILIGLLLLAGSSRLIAQDDTDSPENGSLESLLSTTVSTASKYTQSVSEAAASVTIVTAEDIALFGYRTIEDVLMTVPGFYTSYDRNYSYVGIRGFSRPTDYNDRVLILLNGHTLNENFYGSAYVGPDLGLNMQYIERVEIVHGPGSALYGTGAMFAVVNIIPKSGSMVDGAIATYQYGSLGKRQGSVLFGKELGDGVEFVLSGILGKYAGADQYYEEYDNPPASDGISRNMDWETYGGFHGSLRLTDVSVEGCFVTRQKGIPTGAFDVRIDDPSSSTRDEYSYLEVKYDSRFGSDKRFTAKSFLDWYHYYGTYPYDIPSFDENIGTWCGIDLQAVWDISAAYRVVGGMEFRDNLVAKYRWWDTETSFFDGDFPFRSFSAYVQGELQVHEQLLLTIGIRKDAYSQTGGSLSPRMGIVYHPWQTGTMKLLYGEAFRIPNPFETSYDENTNNHKVHRTLVPEKISTYEGVFEQGLAPGLSASMSLYKYRMRNLIDYKIDPVDSVQQFANLDGVQTSGIDLVFNARVSADAKGYVAYDYQYATNWETDAKLTNSPTHIIKAGFALRLLGCLSTAVELHYETQRLTVYETETDPFLLTNVNLGLLPEESGFGCSFLIRNIFDVKYALPGGFEHRQPSIRQDGRTMALSVSFRP
jgi:outer membrane receptor for ferrienterochelin and colicins